MYLIKYQVQEKKIIRDEGFFFTDIITRTVTVEKSKVVDTEEEIKSFNDGVIISVTKIQ